MDVDACVFVHADPRLLPPISGAASAPWTGTRRSGRTPSLILRGNPGLQAGRETHPRTGGAKRRSALRLRLDGQVGRFWFSVYSRTMLRGAPPREPTKYEGAQNVEPMPIRLIRPVYSARR